MFRGYLKDSGHNADLEDQRLLQGLVISWDGS